MELRVGIGYDTHRLATGGPLRLGGVEIPHDKHAVGHSDADVLLHAVIDAMLGAANLGDIGQWFPDTDEKNRGRDSRDMIQQVMEAVIADRWKVVNLDCIVMAERPKLSPHRERVAESIAHLVFAHPRHVSVKAKTGEKVDAVGTEQAIAAQCVVLLQRLTERGAIQ